MKTRELQRKEAIKKSIQNGKMIIKEIDLRIEILDLVGEYLVLEEKYNKLNKTEFDYFGNVVSYRINWETHDFELDKQIQDRQEEIKQEIKTKCGYWNYLLFIWNRSYFIKKCKLI